MADDDDKVVTFVPKLKEAEERLMGALVDFPGEWMAVFDEEVTQAGDIALILDARGAIGSPVTLRIFRAPDFDTLWDDVGHWLLDVEGCFTSVIALDHYQRQLAEALEYTGGEGAYYVKLDWEWKSIGMPLPRDRFYELDLSPPGGERKRQRRRKR